MATTFMKAQNNAVTAINVEGGITDADLTCVVDDSSVFPTTYPFPVSVDDEIMLVSNNNTGTNTLTWGRAQESTSAVAHDDGVAVVLMITAKYVTDLNTAVNAIENGSMLDDTTGGTNGETAKAATANALYDTAALYVAKTLFDANTIIAATSDNTPAAVTVAEQRVVGRLTSGNIDDITIGIADDNILQVDDAAAADDDFARFTASGIEGIPVATAIAALLAAALPENTAFILDAASSADGKYSGIVRAGVAGATLAFGDLCYLAVADSRWELADADAAATTQGLLGICVLAAASDGDATTMLLWGIVRADTAFPALTIGAPAFVGTTAGDIQTAAPSGSTDCIRVVGQAWTADELFFNPSSDWFELT